MIQLTRVPTMIDPLSPALEVVVCTNNGSQQQLPRIDVSRLDYTADDLPFVPDPSRCNVFGDKETVRESQLLLIYAHNGRLTATGARDGKGHWEVADVSEELTGATVDKPSVRLTFESEQQAEHFTRWVSRQTRLPTKIGTFLRECLIQPPAVVPVAHKQRVRS